MKYFGKLFKYFALIGCEILLIIFFFKAQKYDNYLFFNQPIFIEHWLITILTTLISYNIVWAVLMMYGKLLNRIICGLGAGTLMCVSAITGYLFLLSGAEYFVATFIILAAIIFLPQLSFLEIAIRDGWVSFKKSSKTKTAS